MKKADLSNIAVIIATRNEERHLRGCVDSVLVAGKGRIELIVVDDGSTDGSREILDSYGDEVQTITGRGEGPGKARNVGLAATDRDWIVFTDADCVVPAEWLERLVEGICFAPDFVVSIGGPQLISSQASRLERFFGRFLESVGFVSDYLHDAPDIRTVLHNPTCNVLYRKGPLVATGGFDESLWPCEDLELDLRLHEVGYESLFHPAAGVEHRRPATFRAFFRMMRRYGFGHAQLTKKKGPCQLLHAMPIVVPVMITLWGLLLLAQPIWGIGVLVGLYGVLAFGLRSTVYPLLVPWAVILWVIGFYSGLFGERRIAR